MLKNNALRAKTRAGEGKGEGEGEDEDEEEGEPGKRRWMAGLWHSMPLPHLDLNRPCPVDPLPSPLLA